MGKVSFFENDYFRTIDAENKLQVNNRKRNVCDIIALFDCCDETESVNNCKKKISQKSLECKGAKKIKEQSLNKDMAIEQVPLEDSVLEVRPIITDNAFLKTTNKSVFSECRIVDHQ